MYFFLWADLLKKLKISFEKKYIYCKLIRFEHDIKFISIQLSKCSSWFMMYWFLAMKKNRNPVRLKQCSKTSVNIGSSLHWYLKKKVPRLRNFFFAINAKKKYGTLLMIFKECTTTYTLSVYIYVYDFQLCRSRFLGPEIFLGFSR